MPYLKTRVSKSMSRDVFLPLRFPLQHFGESLLLIVARVEIVEARRINQSDQTIQLRANVKGWDQAPGR